MKILIGCEFSGIVRETFAKKGHDVTSCDLLPTEIPGKHYLGHIENIINEKYDMLIGFPPCTYTCSSGIHWNKRIPGRDQKTIQAIEFFKFLMYSKIPRICLENPVGVLSTKVRKPDQIIQPWMFGHSESKTTCLWLKDLPKLKPTKIIPIPNNGIWDNMTPSGQNKLLPSPDRWKLRSKTYTGIAQAMADQWG